MEPGRKRNGQLQPFPGRAISGGVTSKGVTSGGALLEHNHPINVHKDAEHHGSFWLLA
jgi:hypothetical protein